MKMHFLWILFWLYACDLAQSQTCMIRVLQVQGDKTVDSPLLLDGSKDVLVSIGRAPPSKVPSSNQCPILLLADTPRILPKS